jgi:hypothetical protein
MKFILVNHRTPLGHSSCVECCRPLESGYLREVSTQRRYCDQDCYLRYEAKSLFMPWLAAAHANQGRSANVPTQLGMIASLATASCLCYAIPITMASSMVGSALRMQELMTTKGFGTRLRN